MTESPYEPVNPDKFSRDLAEKINVLMKDESLRTKFGKAGRQRAVDMFSWSTIAAETKKMYESL
jgi:glycosyltransferase involved in cell wall biosynthesis